MTRTSRSDGAGSLPPLSLRGWLRYDVVKRVIDRLGPRTVLEIGCGQGAFGARLATLTSYLGVEPDDESFAVARERIIPRGGEVVHGTHDDLLDGSTYDVVCAFEVLEHLEDDATALQDWVGMVGPGGHLVLSVPADQERFGAWDTYAGHYRRYSTEELRDLLVRAGLDDVRITVYGWPVCYPTEALRNRIAARKLAHVEEATLAELTAASGRRLQPSRSVTGSAIAAAALPFRLLQRARPTKGTGLVAVARRPA